MVWIISMRALQGSSAALMMPTAVAITSAVWPKERRGYALGMLAGGSAFFAALGPVLGGVLTAISWRLVFLINVPLALAAIALTLAGTPAAAAGPGESPAASTGRGPACSRWRSSRHLWPVPRATRRLGEPEHGGSAARSASWRSRCSAGLSAASPTR